MISYFTNQVHQEHVVVHIVWCNIRQKKWMGTGKIKEVLL